ncbi:hypothetical protein Bca52824_050356, partial [Brassica carinata]
MPADLQSTAVSEALPIEIPVTDLRMVERWRFLDLLQRRLFCLGRIRKLLLQLGMKFDTIRSESAIIHAFPFNSGKKRGGVAVLREFFRLAIDAMAKNSLRTQELNKVPKEQEDLDKWSLLEDELTLLAIVGIKDPCRPGVREAVRTCTSAG